LVHCVCTVSIDRCGGRPRGIHRRPKTQQQRLQSGGLPSCWHGGNPDPPSGSAETGNSPNPAAIRHMRTRTLMVRPSLGRLSGRCLRPLARATPLLLREYVRPATALPPRPSEYGAANSTSVASCLLKADGGLQLAHVNAIGRPAVVRPNEDWILLHVLLPQQRVHR
jgi:hypothetical protein